MGGRGFLWIGGIHGVPRPVGLFDYSPIPMGAHGWLWMGYITGVIRLVGTQELMHPAPAPHPPPSDLSRCPNCTIYLEA